MTLRNLLAIITTLSTLATLAGHLAGAATTSTSTAGLDSRYRYAEPWVGVQVSGGVGQVAGRSLQIAHPAQLDLMIQPIYNLGVLSLGPYIQYSVAPKNLNIAWSIGGKALYQFRYVGHQVLVPVGGYEVGRFFYQSHGGRSAGFLIQGPLAGLWLDLGSIDRTNGRDLFSRTEISRVYLTGDFQYLFGRDSAVRVSQTTFNLGLRFEI